MRFKAKVTAIQHTKENVMVRKKWYKTLLVLSFTSFVMVITLSTASAETITINSLSSWHKGAFETAQFLTFIKLVQQEADQKYPGELKMVYKGGPEVIRNREQAEACRNGLIDMVFTAGSYYTSILPEVDTMSLTSMRPWDERKAGVYDYLGKLHEEKANVHMLGRVGTGSLFHMFLAKPIKTIADLKGMKIRCSPTNIPFMKSIGVQPIGMPPPDVPTAMERGVVDGYILPPATIRDFGLIEPSKYMIFPGFYEPCQFILVNLATWKKLPKHLQELLTTETDKMARYAIKNIADQLKAELEDFKKQGMTFIELPPTEAAKWSKLASDALYGVVMKKAPEESKKIYDMITK